MIIACGTGKKKRKRNPLPELNWQSWKQIREEEGNESTKLMNEQLNLKE